MWVRVVSVGAYTSHWNHCSIFFLFFYFFFFLRFVLYTIDFLRPAGGFLTLSSHFPDIMLCTPIDCTSSVLVITTKHKKENHYKLHTFKKQLDKMPLYKRNVLHSLFVCVGIKSKNWSKLVRKSFISRICKTLMNKVNRSKLNCTKKIFFMTAH